MYSENVLVNGLNKTKRVIKTLLGRDHLLAADVQVEKCRLGSRYGGWWVAGSHLGRIPEPVVMSFGIGDDISFDLEIIRRFNARVFAYDPTPKSVEWLKTQQNIPQRFQAFQIGVADFDGEQDFGLPPRPDWDNYSVLRSYADSVRCPVKTIATLLAELRLETFDVLKLDIEGSEYKVLDNFLAMKTYPSQLLVEYHHEKAGPDVSETVLSIKRLRQVGYKVFDVSPWGKEFSLIHSTAL